ncbi:MAG: hypothetical protein ACI9DC_005717, partial [Gammaproteobacteria bacterium]
TTAQTSGQKSLRKETARAHRPFQTSDRDFCSVI